MYVGLAERKDMNEEFYVPKMYRTDHLNGKDTILYKNVNNEKINIIRIPKSIKEEEHRKRLCVLLFTNHPKKIWLKLLLRLYSLCLFYDGLKGITPYPWIMESYIEGSDEVAVPSLRVS